MQYHRKFLRFTIRCSFTVSTLVVNNVARLTDDYCNALSGKCKVLK